MGILVSSYEEGVDSEQGQPDLARSLDRMSVSATHARASACALRTTCSSAPTRRTKLSAIPAVSRWGRKASRTS